MEGDDIVERKYILIAGLFAERTLRVPLQNKPNANYLSTEHVKNI